MKHVLATLCVVGAGSVAFVAGQTATVTPPSSQKSLAATMDVYVFPTGGQTPEQQSKDEGECYNWAVQNTGTDPFQLQKQAQQQQQKAEQTQQQVNKATEGAGAKGAVGGAAAGALIGEIASDDAGKGAAYGAAAGLIMARRRGRAARSQAEEQTQQQTQQAQQATSEQLLNFKKAFSVCLEAKKYMVKY